MVRSRLEADILYYEQENSLYFVSPDGWGVIWYDDLEQVMDEYGFIPPIKVTVVDKLEDF